MVLAGQSYLVTGLIFGDHYRVPLYLEQIQPNLSAEENIRDLCFTRGGLLVREFENIFSDLFSKRSATYRHIVKCLETGPKELVEICSELSLSRGGVRSAHLNDLVLAGFIKREFTWSLKSNTHGKLSRYRLSDNYLRFYLKYIEPRLSLIEKRRHAAPALADWSSIMGLQFENLVVHNCEALWKLVGITPEEVVVDGPFFQHATKKMQGCQIDYMVQTRFNTLYLFEIKFSKHPISSQVRDEVAEKIARLHLPRGFSVRPILVHVNGVSEGLLDERFFDKVIDFSQLLS